MKIHFLPSEQGKLNDKTVEKLRRIGYFLLFLVLASVALGAKMYLWPPPVSTGPQIFASDGVTLYGNAILVAPDLALCAAQVGDSAEFVNGNERIAAARISLMAITQETQVTLLRLRRPSSLTPLAPAIAELNEAVVAVAGGQEWRGVVRGIKPGVYEVEPDFSLASGTPVLRASDSTALIGLTGQVPGGSIIIPAKDIIDKFLDLRNRR